MQKTRAFTLVELVIVLFITLLLISVAVPSLRGVLADRRLRASLDEFNRLAQTAHERSLAERRSYLVVWGDREITVRPESAADNGEVIAAMRITGDEHWQLDFPAALQRDAPPEWIFWPSGNCEPVRISFSGKEGGWTAEYSPLAAAGNLVAYAPR
ncbi:MAG: prepilin-type N-terminal cleavage/methylation domain-containing protein [Verrucomicrobiota bacterium]|nr:prepilin-type N-terminal cleavage/methylation domain-containing protein [Verrucomicrobiota bacterium]